MLTYCWIYASSSFLFFFFCTPPCWCKHVNGVNSAWQTCMKHNQLSGLWQTLNCMSRRRWIDRWMDDDKMMFWETLNKDASEEWSQNIHIRIDHSCLLHTCVNIPDSDLYLHWYPCGFNQFRWNFHWIREMRGNERATLPGWIIHVLCIDSK